MGLGDCFCIKIDYSQTEDFGLYAVRTLFAENLTKLLIDVVSMTYVRFAKNSTQTFLILLIGLGKLGRSANDRKLFPKNCVTYIDYEPFCYIS